MELLTQLSKLGRGILIRAIFAAYLAICILFVFVAPVHGKPVTYHKLQDISDSIQQFAQHQFPTNYKVDTIVNKLDPHLRLTRCQDALRVFYPARARRMGATTLGVQCESEQAWKIFVPVQIKVVGPAVVSNQPLPRGSILQLEDVKLVRRDLSGAINGYFRNVEDIDGMELRVSLAQGQIIGPGAVKPRHLVKRGDIVTIIAETEGLHIQIKGKALMNGIQGQSIRVKNTRSNRVLQGEVIASRTVRIKL